MARKATLRSRKLKSQSVQPKQWRFEGNASAVNVTDERLPAALATTLTEALGKAISDAKNHLGSDLISWAMTEVSGECGGFTELCQVKLAIYAKVGPTLETEP